jgi:hypothetical protein
MAKTSRMRRATARRVLRRAVLLSALVAIPLGWLLTAPAEAVPQQAQAGPTRTVGDSAEAWYASEPVDICTTPLGCPPQQAPTSPYPANTLHVGVAGGRETARTYVLPDLLSLPLGATLTGGVMTLPVDTASTDGTLSADQAQLLGCLVSEPFIDGTAGSSGAAPKANCGVSARPVYDAKKNAFTLDLTPFVKAWSAGQPPFGIALVPNPKQVSPTAAWHVTINGRKLAGRPHVQSVITFTPPPASTSNGIGTTTAPPPPSTPANAPSVSVPNLSPSTTTATAPPPVVAPTQPTTPVAQQPVAYSQSFKYPLAFLAPLALLIGALFFTRLFTRDPLPRRMVSR